MSHQVIRTTNQVTSQKRVSSCAVKRNTGFNTIPRRWRGTIRLWQRGTRQLIFSQASASRFWGRSWSGSALKILDRVRERREAVDAAGLFLHALDAQHVAIAAVELHEPSLDDVFLALTGRPVETAPDTPIDTNPDTSTDSEERQAA